MILMLRVTEHQRSVPLLPMAAQSMAAGSSREPWPHCFIAAHECHKVPSFSQVPTISLLRDITKSSVLLRHYKEFGSGASLAKRCQLPALSREELQCKAHPAQPRTTKPSSENADPGTEQYLGALCARLPQEFDGTAALAALAAPVVPGEAGARAALQAVAEVLS